MPPGNKIRKLAILADPKDPEKVAEIKAALSKFVPHLEHLQTSVEIHINEPVQKIRTGSDIDLFVVMGGDGSMIYYAARLNGTGIPFYGLNYGNVGFMMNNPTDGLELHARRIHSGDFSVWEFPVLDVRAVDLKGEEHEGVGLNDIYLQRMTPQSCKANITINGTSLNINPVFCDGIIVSTPLGSTAYTYNVTGSMVAIDAPVITLTPVAAQRTCPVSCMMLPMDTVIKFDILEPEKRRVQVVSDGQSHGDLTHAEIRVADKRVKLCFGPEYSQNLPMRFINKACDFG